MNNDDDFVERLRNREIAHTDQQEAQKRNAEDQESVQQTVRESARSSFEEMRSYAESLVQQANTKLTEQFTNVAAPGGFGIMLGNKMASFTYAPPIFANEGVPYVIVTFQSVASNFGFFQDGFYETQASILKWELEPVWDGDTNSLLWWNGDVSHSPREIVRHAMERLQEHRV